MDSTEFARGLYMQYYGEVLSRNLPFIKDERVELMCKQIAEAVTKEEGRKFGILLCGLNGIGKTTMARAFQMVVNSIAYYCWNDIKGAIYKTSKDIIRMYDTKAYDNVRETPVLIIDDLGNESTESVKFGNVATPIVDLLEFRYDEQLFTFITTNLTSEQIQEKYGLRVRDRLKEMVELISVKKGSYR